MALRLVNSFGVVDLKVLVVALHTVAHGETRDGTFRMGCFQVERAIQSWHIVVSSLSSCPNAWQLLLATVAFLWIAATIGINSVLVVVGGYGGRMDGVLREGSLGMIDSLERWASEMSLVCISYPNFGYHGSCI